ncbi:hypothetical protein Ae201684P_020514 [Aphanomyces euteiches]|nr:hypothetical protein Ae201684P_020514 [Aphanomyces euteiches]
MEDSPRHATSERQVNEGSNLPTSPAWYPKEGEDLESASSAHPSARGGSRRLSHGSGTPSETATTPHSVLTMAMLQANNEQLIRQLMTMMKNTTQRAPELDDWIDDDPTPVGILQENPNTIRRSILDDHIDRFANSLLDTALGTVIRQQQFVSIDNLESYLERQLANGTTAKRPSQGQEEQRAIHG